MRLRAVLTALLGLLTAACAGPGSSAPFALRGTILTPSTVIPDGLVVVERGRIRRVVESPATLSGIRTIDTDGIILPGLIDLHNHILWSVFPRWKARGAFASRDAWIEAPVYVESYSQPQRALSRAHGCDMNRFGEVRAIVGGVSSIIGSLRAGCSAGLVRNLDHDPGFAGERDQRRANTLIDVDRLSPAAAAALARRLRTGAAGHLFVHVAEGRADDPAPREEFARLVAYGLLTDRTVIVHGNGLGDAEFEAIGAAGAALIWSPRSNLELYGETTSITMAIDRSIPVALASDWSVTGSANLLEELRYASEWARRNLGEALDDRQLVEMGTSVPAAIAGIADRVGSIGAGMYADLLVIRGARDDPYRAVVAARPSDVRLVTIGGEPVYGAWDLVRRLRSRWDVEDVEVCGARMALDTTADAPSLLDFRYRLSATQARLRTALAGVRPVALPSLAECEP